MLFRIDATHDARRSRGWVPDGAKDNMHTETDLDHLKVWSACLDNSDDTEAGAMVVEEWIKRTALPRIFGKPSLP